MGIKLFNLELEKFGSFLCALTSVLLIGLALLALLELGEYVVWRIQSMF